MLYMLRLEVACFIVLAFVAFIYFSGSRRHGKMHTSFSLMLIMDMAQIFFDGATLYTVNHMDTVPAWTNNLLHRFYFTTMLGCVYLFFEHTCLLVEEESKEYNVVHLSPKLRIITRIEVILSEIGMCIMPLSYAVTPNGNYAIGPCSDIIYVNTPLYIVLIVLILVINWNNIHPKKKFAICAAILVMFGVLTATALVNTLLITSMGFTLMTLSYYLTLENPDIYLLEQAREEKQRAEEANASKSAFLSVVSHEIRTPLNAIVGMSDILLKEDLTEKQASYLRNIKTSGDSLVLIVNDLLDQSKIEAGKMEIIEDYYTVQSLVDDVKPIIENRVEGKNIDILVDIDEKIPPVMLGDKLRIKQVLINLMNNAAKFTQSGFIKLSISIASATGDKYIVRFGVKDSGQGIKEEDLGRLFEAFSQVDTRKNHGVEGTGLGLSISRDFISLMGGQLKVSSVYGEGSEFYFQIPQGRAPKDITDKLLNNNDGVRDFTVKEANILVVDDTKMNMIVMEKTLEPLGVNIDKAYSGAEAIEMIKNKAYDLVLMDYMMPNMTGVEATRIIRGLSDADEDLGVNTSEYYKKLSIIALTADVSSEAQDAFNEAGINDFAEKPVKLDKVKELLVRWLDNSLIKYNE